MIFTSVIFLTAFSFAKSQEDTASVSDTVTLSITSNIEGAEVLLDSVKYGFTPLDDLKIIKGEYDLKLINPGDQGNWQNENFSERVTIRRDTLIYAFIPYYYRFMSTPSNAGVYKNDTLLGKTPLRYKSKQVLKGSVEFRKENYKDLFFDMNGYDPVSGANVVLKLRDNAIIEPDVYKNKGTQFKTSRNVLAIFGFAGASIAAGYFAYDFKTKANDYYDDYTLTGNSEDLDNSRTNDTYFAIALVLMQAAIGGLVYFLFFD